MAREVDGNERPVQQQGDPVPGVGVLGAAVQQDDLGRAVAPGQQAQPPARRHLDKLPAREPAVPGAAELPGLLVQEGELVVAAHGAERRSATSPASQRRMRPASA